MSLNNSLQQRKNNAIARGQGNAAQAYIERAENAEMWDIEGNRYIDFGAGIAVVNTGHNHPKVKAAVQAQLEKFSHTCVMVTPYASAVELAEKLNAAAPGNSPKKTIFVTTGAEAVENCVKIARCHTGRSGIIAFHGGFHGRTNFTMGLTGKVAPYKAGFGPFPAGIFHVPYPNEYHGVTVERSLEALEMVFKCDIEASQVAAIIIEPVQGEGGFYQAPAEFMQALRKICDQHGILLIADEIQTGFARTGKMFATEYSNIEPDLMTMAKGIAGGFPLAAVVGKAEIMDSPLPGGLGGTYGGSPIGCAAGLAVLDVIEEEKLADRALQIGERIRQRLQQLQQNHPDRVGAVRHLGAMIALELVKEGDAAKPDADLTKAIVAEAAKRGLILLSCGIRGNVIRFLPALTAPMEIIDEGMDILDAVISSLV
ncbi:4-aminobutyrate aminotransferase / (S)-3-amino-2-methylpropionate transaminase [Oceanospirillum multiglobuliferum]|uniref:4-aminobutyrate--2-oxoglutarate transaminase n=1 Tax=Oceanospirillum multiglobuliferum TaxID=64969 RepID=A0A1T4Q492_9GAMM|nr:4-aminobutyrate--2-oxoglutarate transaminase [Oceanospirillum multiglobuliferum]OPX55524.1 4-aminobutyrate--2-oxoglutarate transaminase [Oceanospirillum multiglobuliferum]SJZ98476.1 4-aminobutyrate aminotransferase / (S)-3-amino-2-methylpropionate transaminase [Oceanospirillum multiglobuliferum]